MPWDFLTLDDVQVEDRTIFVRLDINSPIDPDTGNILDETRIVASVPTLRDLNQAKVVVGSHQSRPGKDDFIHLGEHASILRRYCGRPVTFIEDIMGPAAREAISNLKNGDILVLDNLRFCSEEAIEGTHKQLLRTHFVKRLAPLFDMYVNDAFAASHRSQASMVAFPDLMPAVAGRTMERELKALEKVMNEPARPCVYVLGGVKIEDRIPLIENILASGNADKVLLGGLLAEFFLIGSGLELGADAIAKLDEYSKFLKRVKSLLGRFKDKLMLPIDLAIEEQGERTDLRIKSAPFKGPVKDIGTETTASYSGIVEKAGTVVADGPLGVFEKEPFAVGTKEVLTAMGDSKAFTVVGGGHIGGAAELLGVADRVDHVCTGGGAMLTLLSGQPLPALEALDRSAKRHRGKIAKTAS
ncbi:MAG: phosphoglycerate kinase [Candidatus Bathyarchaeia archaeon]